MASSSNPIAASATTTSNYYQVFISFRGPDVKQTLATHLYNRLKHRGVQPFLDNDELQDGGDILSHVKAAIESASVHIAIFSRNYAESSWCLNELLMMLESGKTIISIFCDGVTPDVLRWTLSGNGVYAQHLRILEDKKTIDPETGLQKPRYDTNTLEEWRSALSRAADLKGFVVEDEACNSDHSQLVNNVVERVLDKLPKKPLHVSKYPVGLDIKVKDLEMTVLKAQQTGGITVVGIVGLGGVGKTTLAKEIFNRERSKHRRSWFLHDVRETAARGSLCSLQSTLVAELTGSQVHIDHIDQGIMELRRRVSPSHSPALIILDDVDDINQLDALLFPVKDALRSSGLILVTSRNKDVLTNFGIDETSIYILQVLNPLCSQELFCWHAFGHPHPVLGFEPVVKHFLETCQGLPLSLRVIGALLYGKNYLAYWEAQLHKISNILPREIEMILKISYDGLDLEEKQMFLDTACFFTGARGNEENDIGIRPAGKDLLAQVDRDAAIRIWEGSGWNGRPGLWHLQNRFLVEEYTSKYTKTQYLRMHNHLRVLGRHLAEKELLGGHRLWQSTENLLPNLSDQSTVRGLLCVERSHLVDNRSISRSRLVELLMKCTRLLCCKPVEQGNGSINMSRLEMLMTRGDCVEHILRRVQSPEYLISLHCDDFPYAFLPRWIPMQRLAVLSVKGLKLERLWGENLEAPLQWRELEIRAPLSKFPNSIGQLKYLEKILVDGSYPRCVCLRTLPEEFCDLQSLEHLELYHCSDLEGLPESFGNLKNLQFLVLHQCSKLRMLPNSFGNLRQLKHLKLDACTSLSMSSGTLGNMTTLKYIDLGDCTEIEILPDQVAHQRYLSRLRVVNTSIGELPSGIRDLTDLEILELGGPSLVMLPDWLGCLTSLKELGIGCPLGGCKKLKWLPDSIERLTQLESLCIKGTGVEYLPPSIMALNNLVELHLRNSPLREVPFRRVGGERVSSRPDALIQWMLGLEELYVSRTKISEVAFGTGVCPNLQLLHIEDCERLVEVGTLPSTLVELELVRCRNLENMEGLCGLAKLQKLNISLCPKVEELSGLGTLESLEKLKVNECGVTGILGLQQLTELRVLRLSMCDALEELAGIKDLMGLRELRVHLCPNLHLGEEVLGYMRQRAEEGLLYLDFEEVVSVRSPPRCWCC